MGKAICWSSRRTPGSSNLWAWLFTGLAVATGSLAAPPPRFPSGSVWHQNIAVAPLHPNSQGMLTTLSGLGGWGNSNRFQIDFSIVVRQIGSTEPVSMLPVVRHKTFDDYYLPDCEPLGTLVPVTADTQIEGGIGLTCDNGANDCHLLVRRGDSLYEVYSANVANNEIDALCLAVWNLSAVYPEQGRGEHCTSADAAGFPIAPLLVNADEVAAAIAIADSDLGHAIRFILPNSRMASDASLGGVGGRLYVRPASHAGGPNGPVGSVPYGVRMRLRADFPLTNYSPAAQVVLRTMQRFGIVLSDGGNIALTFENDRFTTAKWSGFPLTAQVFFQTPNARRVEVTDFEVIDTGARIGETYDCVRTTITPGPAARIFANGFEDA